MSARLQSTWRREEAVEGEQPGGGHVAEPRHAVAVGAADAAPCVGPEHPVLPDAPRGGSRPRARGQQRTGGSRTQCDAAQRWRAAGAARRAPRCTRPPGRPVARRAAAACAWPPARCARARPRLRALPWCTPRLRRGGCSELQQAPLPTSRPHRPRLTLRGNAMRCSLCSAPSRRSPFTGSFWTPSTR